MAVYFISNGKGKIKIGHSEDPGGRLRSLQSGCPDDLSIVFAIPEWGRDEEQALHRRFADVRVRGEWFSREGDLKSFMMSMPNAGAWLLRKGASLDPSSCFLHIEDAYALCGNPLLAQMLTACDYTRDRVAALVEFDRRMSSVSGPSAALAALGGLLK